jgi:fructokinase
MPIVTCFGEVLWDIFPDHKKIGGAPFNVALRLNSFGIKTNFISRVGDDKNGKEILEIISQNYIDTSLIQIDKKHKTGCVNVTLDKKGSATYEIEYPVAWDKIELTQIAIDSVKNSDAFVFGSLACRDVVTKNTLVSLMNYAVYKVFDVNLRAPFYSIELLKELMYKADFIKCNDDELIEICNSLGCVEKSIELQVRFLASYTKTRHICITRGAKGALLYYNDHFFVNSGYKVEVADTVGAGDSFLATLIVSLLFEENPQTSLDKACAVGSLVVSRKGANPQINQREINELLKKG